MSTPPLPPRGSPAYHRRVIATADTATLEEAIRRLADLWQDYGPRAALDVMTEWVVSMDFLTPAPLRDLTGAVHIPEWDPTDEQMLAQVVDLAQRENNRTGRPLHEAFTSNRELVEGLVQSMIAWRPYLRQAFQAAHTRHDRDAIRAELARGPGIATRQWHPVRDGAGGLHTLASWSMSIARKQGYPVRPPDGHMVTEDRTSPLHLPIDHPYEGATSYDLSR